MRIAVGGIHTECSTYSPVLMGQEDFRVFRGAELLEAEYFNFLAEGGAEVLPLLHARAVPGGPVSRPAYDAFKREFLERLKASLPLDGLYLAMHGAMNVEGMDDAEGDWISSARTVVGPDVVISASYDLHGNVSQTIIDQLDIFAGYRTAPHIDVRETMVRAWTMLIRALETGTRPGIAWAKIPVLLPGEKTSTEDEPARSLYAFLPDHDAVVTGTDKAAAQAIAAEIAQSYWDARQDFHFGPVTEPLAKILDIAETTTTRPIILADSGDNPTGGGVGDRADVLAALLARDWQGALVGGITDRPAVEACFAAGEGAILSLKIGGSLDPKSPSVTVEAEVVTLDDPGAADQRQAVIVIGGITVILAARRRPYHMIYPSWLRSEGRAASGGEIRLPVAGACADRQSQPHGVDGGCNQSGY